MTERSTTTEREGVCPFVAFDEDRDYRSSVPDHRHRCFAERPAATRALAHQAAYCLSSAFPSCPTFIDWARREAAPAKEEPIRTLREAPSAPRQADRPAEQASRPTGPQDGSMTSQRQRRADWTAPPPWVPDAGAEPRPADLARPTDRSEPGDVSPGSHGEDADEDIAACGAARRREPRHVDRIRARGPRRRGGPAMGAEAPRATRAGTGARIGRGIRRGASAGLPRRPRGPARARREMTLDHRRPTTSPARRDARGQVGPAAPEYDRDEMARPRPPRRGRSDANRAVGRIADRVPDRGIGRAAQDPAAPSWERPRRFEAYPSLKSSGGRLAALPRPGPVRAHRADHRACSLRDPVPVP